MQNMTVNQNGTDAGEELLAALDATEQQPTDEPEETGEDITDEGDEGAEDSDLEDVPEDEDAEDEVEDGTALYTVKINGQEEQVTLRELQDGYMKEADYRRKTADLADTRKRAEAVEAQYSDGLKTLEGQLEMVASFIAGQINVDEAEMDRLANEKPAEYVATQRELAKKGNALRDIDAQLQRVRAAQADAVNRKMTEFRNAETAKLQEVAPEFRKSETTERLHSYLKDTYGLSKDEIESVADHRFALIAEKARRFDAIKTKAALKDKQVRKDPAKFQKGGVAQRTNDASKARKEKFGTVMKSGKVDDLAALF